MLNSKAETTLVIQEKHHRGLDQGIHRVQEIATGLWSFVINSYMNNLSEAIRAQVFAALPWSGLI